MAKLLPTGEILTLLAAGSARLAASTAGLTEAQLHTVPSEGEWSANDVLAHLRACADVWGAHVRPVLQENAPVRQAMNPRTYIKHTDYPKLDFAPSLRTFAAQRGGAAGSPDALAARGLVANGHGKGLGPELPSRRS